LINGIYTEKITGISSWYNSGIQIRL
jgi:hypothetical protein